MANGHPSRDEQQGHRDESRRSYVAGETRQPAPGATPNRQAMTWPTELAGRWLERVSNRAPRGMTAAGAQAFAQNPAYRPTPTVSILYCPVRWFIYVVR